MRGGYLVYRRGVQYRGGVHYHGGKSFVIWVPHSTEHPPRFSWYPPRYSNFKAWYPPRYWTLFTVLMISPTCIMISPTVLNILHDTQDNPHGTHDITPWYWTPPRYLRYPPRYWTPPRYSRYPPRYSWYPPTVLNTPTALSTTHGTAHTLYRVVLLEVPSQSKVNGWICFSFLVSQLLFSSDAWYDTHFYGIREGGGSPPPLPFVCFRDFMSNFREMIPQ